MAKYMLGKPGSPTWRSFLRTQAIGIAAIDMFGVQSATFRLLFVALILVHDRRKAIHFNVIRHSTAASGYRGVSVGYGTPISAPLDRDASYGSVSSKRVAAMRITEIVTAQRSPWQTAYVERVIGSIRRESWIT